MDFLRHTKNAIYVPGHWLVPAGIGIINEHTPIGHCGGKKSLRRSRVPRPSMKQHIRKDNRITRARTIVVHSLAFKKVLPVTNG